MNLRHGFPLLLACLLALLPRSAVAQAWDPAQSATGWASFDRDGSCVFHNRAGRKLVVWSRDGGPGEEVDLGKLATPPDRWLLDPNGNAWVVCGPNLARVANGGKVGPVFTLPAEVGDLAWDARSFVLCYRTRQAYLERRDLMTGALLWSHGPKPPKGEADEGTRHPVAISEDGKIYLNSGSDFQLHVLDSAKGTLLAVLSFTLKGGPAPPLGVGDRGALAWWMNNNCALLAVPATQLPPGSGLKGLVLAKLDLAKGELTLTPTGLDEKASLAGTLEADAVLLAPGGGLSFFPIP